jgi:hypothetical protein
MNSLDPSVKLLSILLVMFVAALFLGEWWFKSDAQFYQTLAGLVTGVSGALLMRITGHSNQERTAPPAVPDPVAQTPTVSQIPEVK